MNYDIRQVHIKSKATLSYMTALYAFQDKEITEAEFNEVLGQIEQRIKLDHNRRQDRCHPSP